MSDKPYVFHWVSGLVWSLMLQAVKSLFRKKAFVPIYNIHSYLQRSQIYNYFLKAFFFFFCSRWFFQIRMRSSTKMRRKKRAVNTWGFSLGDSYC